MRWCFNLNWSCTFSCASSLPSRTTEGVCRAESRTCWCCDVESPILPMSQARPFCTAPELAARTLDVIYQLPGSCHASRPADLSQGSFALQSTNVIAASR